MAEALSFVASIVAVLQLSGKIASYIGAAKDTKSDIVRIQAELEVILAALQDMIDRNTALKTLERCGQCLSRCEEVVNDVVEKLEQSENIWKRIGGPLLWPLREKDMAKLLNAITQQKSTIALALAVDHMYGRVEGISYYQVIIHS